MTRDAALCAMKLQHRAKHVYDSALLAFWMDSTTASAEYHFKELDTQIAELEEHITAYKAARAADIERTKRDEIE